MTENEGNSVPDHRHAVSRETTPGEPSSAAAVFGDRLEMARHYVARLASVGIERGLLGPREVPRLWNRHVLNSAVIADLIQPGCRVADVGSGAGLPGIPLAIARPDLHVMLVEPLLRRSDFLRETVVLLGLKQVDVVRARAEDLDSTVDVVTARAVAPLERLAGWTLPLVGPGGRLIALKGESVSEELRQSAASLATMGAESWRVEHVGVGLVEPPTRVVVVTMGRNGVERTRRGRQRRNDR